MAHPRGLIETNYVVKAGQLQGTVTLPKGVEGEFVWGGQVQVLKAGVNRIALAKAP